MCVTKIFHFLAFGANPGPKLTKTEDDLLPTQVYLRQPMLEISVTKICRQTKLIDYKQ